MKFVIASQELNALISGIHNVVPQKPAIPILANFLLEVRGDELVFTATDLTVTVRCRTAVRVQEEGAMTVPARRFVQLSRELTASHVEVRKGSSDIAEISAGSSRFKLFGMNAETFPTPPDMVDAVRIRVEQKALRDLLFRTSFAVSREDNKYVLTGVLAAMKKGKLVCTGTDGKRLARALLPNRDEVGDARDYIIPIKAVDEIYKALTDEGEATLYLASGRIAVETPSMTIITKLLVGEYPDVDRVIPRHPSTVVTLHREELMTLLRQVALFTSENSHSVRFTFQEGELQLSANTMEIGEGKVMMPANYWGERQEIAFNPTFLLDILRHCKEERVSLGIIDSFNPGIIKDGDPPPAFNEEVSPTFVLMPLRLADEEI